MADDFRLQLEMGSRMDFGSLKISHYRTKMNYDFLLGWLFDLKG